MSLIFSPSQYREVLEKVPHGVNSSYGTGEEAFFLFGGGIRKRLA